MRDEIMDSTEEDFVRSLSHCVNWQARGGKSGAVFYATEGERHEHLISVQESLPKSFPQTTAFFVYTVYLLLVAVRTKMIAWVLTLQHISKWMSASFLSLDDRFILKQMPRLEVQSFLDFAPHYFTYITGAVQQKVGPLLLVSFASIYSIS